MEISIAAIIFANKTLLKVIKSYWQEILLYQLFQPGVSCGAKMPRADRHRHEQMVIYGSYGFLNSSSSNCDVVSISECLNVWLNV